MHERHEIPLPRTERPGVFWSLFVLFLWVGSPLLAVDNLRHWNGGFDIIAALSLFWLCLITVHCISVAPTLPPILRNVVGSFSNNHFFAVESDGYVSAGFRFFGFELLHFGLPMMLITNVYASAGQASGLAGKDMDDWRIIVSEPNNLHILGRKQPHEFASEQVASIHDLLARVDWTPGT